MLGPAKFQSTLVPSTVVGAFGLYVKSAALTGITFVTENADGLIPVPLGDATPTGPEAAPVGTTAVIRVSESIEKTAAVPPKVVTVASVKFVPVIEMDVPTAPAVGSKDATTGAGEEMTVNVPELVATPAAVLTETAPDLAPAGMVVTIVLSSVTANAAASPLNRTEKAPVNPVPVMVT